MKKEISQSKAVASKTIFAAFQILKESGGSLKAKEIIEKIKDRVEFTDWEKQRYEKTGYIRWESIMHFFTIDCIKAGFLIKNKGAWTLTTEGEEAMKLGAVAMLENATNKYRQWSQNRTTEDLKPIKDIVENISSDVIEQEQKVILTQYEERADDGLRNHVLLKNPYEFQDMVAALLQNMGYYISHISPKGRDGGIDIIAYTDPLGTKPPRIIVQVKHKPDKSVPSDDIQRLIGTMKRESDVGIFVTSGDFSNPAKQEARLSGKHVELIDFDRFIEFWIQYYNKMTDEQKYMLPLHPIYFLGSNE